MTRVLVSFAAALALHAAQAQQFPQDRPIRVLTAAVGGGNDLMARTVAQGLTETLGTATIVDNRGRLLAVESVVRANADGHTLLAYGTSVFLSQILDQGGLIYASDRDIKPVTLTGISPLVLVVTPSLPVKSVSELIAYARANPGKLNHSSANPGSSSHLTPELFKRVANVNIVGIPYKSGSQELVDLMAGRVQVAFINPGQASAQIRDGKLRALAVTSSTPSALMPGLPTLASQGLPNFFDMASKYGLFAPANTPAPIVQRINREVVAYLSRPKVQEAMLVQGIEVMGSSPQEFATIIQTELKQRTALVVDLGLIPQPKK